MGLYQIKELVGVFLLGHTKNQQHEHFVITRYDDEQNVI